MDVESLTRRVYEKRIVENTRSGKPKILWEMVKHDMRIRNLPIEDVYDRKKWRRCWRQLHDPDISGYSPCFNRQMEDDDDNAFHCLYCQNYL